MYLLGLEICLSITSILTVLSGIYVFHTWSFCAGRKTSTIGLLELFYNNHLLDFLRIYANP